MSIIGVRTGLGEFQCVVGISDSCMYCGGYITWGMDRNGTPVAQPWGDSEESTELHINRCQQSLECHADPPGVEMTLSTWCGLLMLCHPDRHVKTVNEKLATSLTRWLLASAVPTASTTKQSKGKEPEF